MKPTESVALTWPQFGIICGICALAGTAVGVPVFIATQSLGTPWQDAVGLIPLVVIEAAAVSLVFALVGTLIGAIPILLMRRHRPRAPVGTWIIVGGLAGGIVGALHPFVILIAIIGYIGGNHSLSGLLSLVALPAASGCVSGVLVGWWYKTTVIGDHPEATLGSTIAGAV